MPELKDPAFLPQLVKIERTKTFTDPRCPGEEWEFTFSVQPGLPESLLYDEKVESLKKFYIQSGNYADGNEPVILSEKLVSLIALLMTHYRPKPGTFAWQFWFWATFAERAPDAFADAVNFVASLQAEARGGTADELERKRMEGRPVENPLGNASAAGGVPS